MTDAWTERLSSYLDGEMTTPERVALEAHLAGCEDCARTLGELRAVVARTQALEDRPPDADLWPGIAARIGRDANVVSLPSRRSARRRVSFSFPQLVAAGVALVLISSAGAWLAVTQIVGADRGAAASPALGGQPTVATSNYDAAVRDLERALAARRDQLDTATVRVLEENLGIIDQAISEARAALAEDPANAYLNAHLAATMWRKVHFLQKMAAVANQAS